MKGEEKEKNKGRKKEEKSKQARNLKKNSSFLLGLSHYTSPENILMTCLCLISSTLPPICHLI